MSRNRPLHTPLILLITLLSLLSATLSIKYTTHDIIPLYSSILGPHHNPQETYSYDWLPFCQSETREVKKSSLGESLQGIELVAMPIEIRFKDNVDKQTLCKKRFTKEVVEKFTYAVSNQYWYQLYLDDLPMWAMVGGIAKESPIHEPTKYIFTHQAITIGYNDKNEIVQVDLTAQEPQQIRAGFPIVFTYSVHWVPSNIKYEQRFRRYLEHTFFEHRIHWFSIFNSFLLVLFLSGMVFVILMRALKKDLKNQMELPSDFSDESGWKQVHGDVFRAPSNLTLLSALLGTGFQIIFLVLLLIFMATIGAYYDSRGAVVTTFIITHALTSMLSGYQSAAYYAQHKGKRWIRTAFLTAFLLPGVCFLVGVALNTFALFYASSQVVPFLTILSIFSLFFVITLPLVFVGTIVARRMRGKPNFPCRINTLRRPIPAAPWYLKRWFLIIVGGLLPFGSIFIETYFIFTSVWSYKYYYVYGFTFMIYLILVVVCACVSIVVTYFLLNAEDYRWAWTAFLTSASTGLYVFLYSVYFYMYKTRMQGIFQMAFYFGYSTMISFGLAIMCGTLGFLGTSLFVRTLYKHVKVD